MHIQIINDLHKIFDYKDGKLYWKIKPSDGIAIGAEAGSSNGKRHCAVTYKGKHYIRSRLIFAYHHNRWPNPVCDHINGDNSDDRIENLREATWEGNNRNRRVARNNKLGVKGVRKDKSGKYIATICLGCFDTLEEAKKTREEAAKKLHGEFYHG